MRRSNPLIALLVLPGVLASAERASAFYHPSLGRFTSRDPIAQPVGTRFIPRDVGADGPHLYQYERSSPARYRDPSGLAVNYPGTAGHQRVINASSHNVTVHGDWEEFTTADGVVRYPGTTGERDYFLGFGLTPVVRHSDEVLHPGESTTSARMTEGRFVVDADYLMTVEGASAIYDSRQCNCGAKLETEKGAIKWTGGRPGHKLGHNWTSSRTYVVGDCVVGDVRGVWVEDQDDLAS